MQPNDSKGPSQEAVELTQGERLVEEWRTRASKGWLQTKPPVGEVLMFPETQSLADAVDSALRAVERRTLERAQTEVFAELLMHEEIISKLTYGKEGVVRSTNVRWQIRELRRRLERLFRSEIASLSLPREGAKPHVCTYQCADTDCENVVGPAPKPPTEDGQ